MDQGEKSHIVEEDEQRQEISDNRGKAGSWQGWLTGWYSWGGTTESTDAMDTENASLPFIGEPPTTKGKRGDL